MTMMTTEEQAARALAPSIPDAIGADTNTTRHINPSSNSNSSSDDNNKDTENDNTKNTEQNQRTTTTTSLAYAANPMRHSIIFILILDFFERFAFNGVLFTMTGYLTGYYEPAWNPGFSPFEANSYIAMSQGIGFLSPFFAAIVADAGIGDYYAIVFFTIALYIPGLFLIAALAIPGALDKESFPINALRMGTHILFPLGFGAAKTLYGVYAAKQFNPVTQQNEIQQFFVVYTAVEFLGSFLGAVICILVAHHTDIVIAEFMNAAVLILGIGVFLLGTRRYVNGALQRDKYILMFVSIVEALLCCTTTTDNGTHDDAEATTTTKDRGATEPIRPHEEKNEYSGDVHEAPPPTTQQRPRTTAGLSRMAWASPGFQKVRQSQGGTKDDSIVDGMIQMLWLFPIYGLLIPFNVAFTQVTMVAITQANFLQRSGAFNGAMLVSTSFLFIGLWAVLIKKFITPFLDRRQIQLTICRKFVLGSVCLFLALSVCVIVSSQMKRVYNTTGEEISIFYGLIATFLVGGLAFSFAATNELAFVVAPTEFKMLGTAVMLFMTQGIPNIIGSRLFKRLNHWFQVDGGVNVTTLEHYVNSNAQHFTYLMMGFTIFDAILFSLPPVTRWMGDFEERSIANNIRHDAKESNMVVVERTTEEVGSHDANSTELSF